MKPNTKQENRIRALKIMGVFLLSGEIDLTGQAYEELVQRIEDVLNGVLSVDGGRLAMNEEIYPPYRDSDAGASK